MVHIEEIEFNNILVFLQHVKHSCIKSYIPIYLMYKYVMYIIQHAMCDTHSPPTPPFILWLLTLFIRFLERISKIQIFSYNEEQGN